MNASATNMPKSVKIELKSTDSVVQPFLDLISFLNEECSISTRMILSDMLYASSQTLREDVSIEIVNSNQHFGETFLEEDLEMQKELEAEELLNTLHNSEIDKTCEKLIALIHRYSDLDKHLEKHQALEKLFEIMPFHAREWKKHEKHSNFYYPLHSWFITHLMKGYVVLNQPLKLKRFYEELVSLNSIIGNECLDLDYVRRDFERFSGDIPTFGVICEFLVSNPKFPQKKIFSQLSLDGRKSSYMLEWGEKHKKITRVKHGDTWLLSTAN